MKKVLCIISYCIAVVGVSAIMGYADTREGIPYEARIDYEEEKEDFMVSWFFSFSQYGAGHSYNVLRGIDMWDQCGIGPMFVNVEGMSEEQIAISYKERADAVWKEINDSTGYDFTLESESIRNAVWFLIYGKQAEKQEGYTGEYTSILDISDKVFMYALEVLDGVEANSNINDFNTEKSLIHLWKDFTYRIRENPQMMPILPQKGDLGKLEKNNNES